MCVFRTLPFLLEVQKLETVEVIIKISALITAVLVIWGAFYGLIKWFQKQEKQSTDIEELKKLHISDIENARKREAEDMQAVKDELCVLNYAVLATLDGLKQLGANGNVTKAHNELEKHINKQAHGQ